MFEERPDIRARLETELVAWLTTVHPDGTPQSSPVWFLARTDSFIVYSLARTPRLRNIRANPKVCLHLNSWPGGNGLVIVEGLASVEADGPPASEDPEYMAKYEKQLVDMTAEGFAREYPVRIRIDPTRLRAS